MSSHDNDVRTGTTGTSGTTAGRDVTSRMAGTSDERRADVHTTTTRKHGALHPKTSVAAVFALVFGLAALFCALTAILSPLAVLFGLIGIGVGIAGLKMSRRPGVTGHGVAVAGIVTAVLGLLLGAAVLAGLSVLVNDEARLDQLQNQIEELRNDAPSTQDLREELPS